MTKGTVSIGGLAHESNTYSPLYTRAHEFWMDQADFRGLKGEIMNIRVRWRN